MLSYNLGLEFEKVASQFQMRTAIQLNNKKVTYKDLNALTNQLARWLMVSNLQCGDRVCMTSKKTMLTFALMLACLKIGVAYVFIDRYSPVARLNKIFKTCRPSLIIADQEFYKNILEGNIEIPVFFLEEIQTLVTPFPTIALEETTRVPSSTLAYIMFTSGSTGSPKGVAIPHQNVIQFRNWGIKQYGISETDILTNVNPLFFDNSVFDFYMSLFSGACLLPLNRADLKDPGYAIHYVDQCKATIWFSIPSLIVYLLNLHVLTKKSFKHIRHIIFGGEGFPKPKLKELFSLVGDRIKLNNVYGPTECTCICSSYAVSQHDFAGSEAMATFAPLGKRMINHFYHLILDDVQNPVKDGEIGELYLGGMNVGKGYFGNPGETKRAFIQNPFHQDYRDIVYKTGDLIRRNPKDKKMYFCGRKDSQIKFMGYRIELGEVEAALSSINSIQECALTYGKKDGYDQITSFVVSTLSKKEIRDQMMALVPTYMVPRKFIHMETLPKNINGKIDRKRLCREYYD